jgi:hypothetical protein
MRSRGFLSSFSTASAAAVSAALLFVACGGNVVVDKPTGGTGGVVGGTGGVLGGTGGAGATGVGGAGCPAGSTACGNLCVDTKTDPFHCGSCMNVCPSGVSCVDGYCLVGEGGAPPGCPPGQTSCPDGCFDLQTDSSHCGSCNVACAQGSTCVGGGCAAEMCVHCGETITPDGNPGNLPTCPGTSADIYQALLSCVCVKKCAFQCGDNACAMKGATKKCQDCILDQNAGCGKEFNNCANDI